VTFHECVAGVDSVFPAPSVALTSNTWLPARRPLYTSGLEQAVKEAPSRLHSNVEPASLALKTNVAVVSVVGSVGPESIVVWGALVSTVHEWLAGVESVCPAASVARTSKV
jgi:hypothetical protein